MTYSQSPAITSCAQRVIRNLWNEYTSLVTDARTIEAALRQRGDVWNEDHIAFRTFPGPNTGGHVLAAVFEAMGYRRREEYYFEDKKLRAFWFEPPMTQGRKASEICPKVFISEIIPDSFSAAFQDVIARASAQVNATPLTRIQELAREVAAGDTSAEEPFVQLCTEFLLAGPSWSRPVTRDYEILRAESEYAAWTYVFGGRVNHFTVSAQLMETFKTLTELNSFIQNDLKIPMNASGGLIKGNYDLRLEQSSTLAVPITTMFQEGPRSLPYAFVEFAFRHPADGRSPDGLWHSYYQGFRASNADKIFESTNVR